MKLVTNSLCNAIASMERALKFADKRLILENIDEEETEVIKAGVIQKFEFTYELCWKFMKRWIEENISTGVVDGVTRRELFRLSAENRLIVDVEGWMEYHKARNRTSHAYDENIAEEVYQAAVKFLPEAKDFLIRLEVRND
ncbi:nucleotidyltransferase substrate binding protein [bacterium]|nr:nucleotidyltransferase substrate binding protein [bacterium]